MPPFTHDCFAARRVAGEASEPGHRGGGRRGIRRDHSGIHVHIGNLVHHFDVPGQHRQLTIIADALVDVETPAPLPETLGPGAWDELDAMIDREDYWDMLMPSGFARTSPELDALAKDFGVVER